jgi:hypothetical protein
VEVVVEYDPLQYEGFLSYTSEELDNERKMRQRIKIIKSVINKNEMSKLLMSWKTEHTRFWGLLETLSVAGISNLRVDVDTVGLVVGPHAVRRRRICGTRNAELNRMIIVTVEGLLQVPDDRICGNLE